VSTVLTAFGNYLDSILPFGKVILTVLNVVVSLVLISFLFAAIYKVLPDRNLEWGDVVVGAIVTGAPCSPSENPSLVGTSEAVQLLRASEPRAR
jgi:uncharacterized BrkB/YihY/UPF0761 family membrane protein